MPTLDELRKEFEFLKVAADATSNAVEAEEELAATVQEIASKASVNDRNLLAKIASVLSRLDSAKSELNTIKGATSQLQSIESVRNHLEIHAATIKKALDIFRQAGVLTQTPQQLHDESVKLTNKNATLVDEDISPADHSAKLIDESLLADNHASVLNDIATLVRDKKLRVQIAERAKADFIGMKQGRIKALSKSLSLIPKPDKPTAGETFRVTKEYVSQRLQELVDNVAHAKKKTRVQETFDATPPGVRPRLGRVHPLTQTMEELKDIMGRLGFTVADGPEVEDEWHNFEALNIPASHPARDPLENFYLAAAGKAAGTGDLLLRSQTSTVQIRVMENQPPPVRIISIGRVYRPDTADATHYPMFHQIEGLLVDQGVTMAHLKTTLRLFAASYLGHDVHIRFRPSFFPFTEPSVEVDMSWNDGWIEMGGAGMVDPHVLRAVGYDPDEVTGFAFGLGVERVCMRRHNVTDIREFYKNDVRFLEQF